MHISVLEDMGRLVSLISDAEKYPGYQAMIMIKLDYQ